MLLQYSGIFAKIKAMQNRLLTNADYFNLACLPSVHEIGIAIREYPSYKDILKDLSGAQLRRLTLERKLKFALYDDFAKIFNFITVNIKYLSAYSKKFEIDILKLLLRAVLDERDMNYALPEPSLLLRNRINIDIQKLSSCKRIEEFISSLEGTEYHKILTTVYNTNPSLFAMEMHLDLYYYLKLWKSQGYLDKKNKELQKYVNGIDIDIHNILWIYRAKKYYDMENSFIFTYLIPIHYKISQNILKNLVESTSIDDFLDILSKTYYKDFFNKLKDNISVEEIYRRYMKKIHFEIVKLNPYSLCIVTAYIYKKEEEIKNITSLIEGKRYDLDKNEILNHIVLPVQSGVEDGVN